MQNEQQKQQQKNISKAERIGNCRKQRGRHVSFRAHCSVISEILSRKRFSVMLMSSRSEEGRVARFINFLRGIAWGSREDCEGRSNLGLPLQSTSDNSNLQGKSKTVRVIGSSSCRRVGFPLTPLITCIFTGRTDTFCVPKHPETIEIDIMDN